MVLAISIALAAFIGIVYGIVKNSRTSLVASVIVLIIEAILIAIYCYLYSLTPY